MHGTMPSVHVRPADPSDDSAMAALINYAGEDLPHFTWERMAEPGETAWDVGRRRARREEGCFSYTNTTLLETDGTVAAALIDSPLPDDPTPTDTSDMPAMFVPLQELEDLAPGTWYVNVLAAFPRWRGRGFGSRLLALAEEKAVAAGRKGLSIIASDGNTGAVRLYERKGYRFAAKRPMVKGGWDNPGENWVLLVKPLQP